MDRYPREGAVIAALFDRRVSVVSRPVVPRVPCDVERPPHLSRAPIARIAEFAAGRECARVALTDAGARDTSVGVGAFGDPEWPRGFVGSIAHTKSVAVAAAAAEGDWRSLGIDVEELADDVDDAAVALDAREMRLCIEPTDVTIAFSAKESVMKCLHPLVGSRFDFEDARLIALDACGAFRVMLTRTLASGLRRGFELEGRFFVADGRVFTSAGLARCAS